MSSIGLALQQTEQFSVMEFQDFKLSDTQFLTFPKSDPFQN